MNDKTGMTKQVPVMMHPDMHRRLKEMAFHNNTTISTIVRKGAARMLKDEELRREELERHRAERRESLA